MKKAAALLLVLLFSSHCAVWAFGSIVVDEAGNVHLKGDATTTVQKEKPKVYIVDEFVNETLKEYKKDKTTKEPLSEIPVFISSSGGITTRKDVWEGKEVEFIVAKDVNKDGKVVLQKGEKITGRIELVTLNGPFGSPADLTLSNFVLPDGKKLTGEIRISGANRSYWVYPLGYSMMPFFFAGAAVFTVRGGHAKIKPEKEFELVY